MFIRCRDDDTGHQFDLPEGHRAIGNGVTPLESDRYPDSRVARPPKHHVPRARKKRDTKTPESKAEKADSGTDVPDPDGPDDSPSRPAGHDTTTRNGAPDHG